MSYNYNIEKSIVDTGLPTTYRSLDPNSPQNQQLTEADVLAAKSAMQKLLNEVQIRFDNDPKFLTKRDFGKLIELLQSSFGWLYSVPQFKQIIDDWEDLIKNDSNVEDKEIQLPSAQLVYESIKEMGSYIDLYVNNIHANTNEVNEWYNMFVNSNKLPYWDGEHNTRFTFNGNPKLVEVETDKYGILLTDADDSITWYQQGAFAWEYNIEVLDNGLHLSDSEITIDGVSYTAKDGIVTVELNPGQHTVRCGEYECVVTKIWSNATNYEIYVQDPLILYRDPELDMEAATKQYVDNCVSNYSPEAGRNIQIDKNQGEQGKDYIHALGYKWDKDRQSFAIGEQGSNGNIASGNYSFAEGLNAIASGQGSSSQGYNTSAQGQYSHAEGVEAKADGFGSHAEGYKTIAGRINEEKLIEQSVDLDGGFKDDVADIDKVLAIQSFAHAEGIETAAYTRASHTEGIDTLTDAQTLEDSRTSYIGYTDAEDKTLDYTRYHELNLRGYYITPRCYYATSGVDGLDANKLANSGLTYIPVQNGTNALLTSKEAYYDTSSVISTSSSDNPEVLYIQVIGDLYSPTITSNGSNTITIRFDGKRDGSRKGYIYISSFLTSDLSYSASFSQNYSCNYSTETVLGTSTSSVLKDQSVIRFRINPTTTQYISGTVCTLTLTLSRPVNVERIPDYTYYHFESDFGYRSSYHSAERKETIIYNAPKYLIGSAAHAEGISTEVKATAAHAEGYKSKALGEGAHAEGFDTKALAPYSHTSGFKTRTDGDFSTAIGVKSTTGKTEWKYVELPWFKTDTIDSTQAGIYTTEWNRDDLGVYYSSNHTANSYSYASVVFPEGREFKLLLWNEGELGCDYIEYTDVNSETYDNSTEEVGQKEVYIQASSRPQVIKLRYQKDGSDDGAPDRGFFSIMELYHFGQLATGISTHAEGCGSTSTGIKTSANGVGSFTQGIGTQATGVASIAAGYQTIASGDKQVVVGKYNEETDAAFVIGNGTEERRSNAFVVHWDGRVLAGAGELVATDSEIIVTTSEAIGILQQEVNSLHNSDIILDEAIGMLHQKVTAITEEQINSIFNLLNQ